MTSESKDADLAEGAIRVNPARARKVLQKRRAYLVSKAERMAALHGRSNYCIEEIDVIDWLLARLVPATAEVGSLDPEAELRAAEQTEEQAHDALRQAKDRLIAARVALARGQVP